MSRADEFRRSHASVDEVNALRARAEAAEASLAKMREALTPSAETKAAYIGEFSLTFPIAYTDEDGVPQEEQRKINVPWTTIKQIMKAIRDRAALQTEAPDA